MSHNLIVMFFFTLIIFLSVNITTVHAQEYFLQISINGLKTISQEQVLCYLKIDTSKTYPINELFSLETTLNGWGYFSTAKVQIKKLSDTLINIGIEISENPPLKSMALYINGKKDTFLVSQMKSTIGIAYNQKLLNEDIDALYKIPYVSAISSQEESFENSVSIRLDITKDTPLVFRIELWDYTFTSLTLENIDIGIPITLNFSVYYDFNTSFTKDIKCYPYVYFQLPFNFYLFYGYNTYDVEHSAGFWLKSEPLKSFFLKTSLTELNTYAFLSTRSTGDSIFLNMHLKSLYNYHRSDIEIAYSDRIGSRITFGGSEFFDNPSIDIVNFFFYCRGSKNQIVSNARWAINLSFDAIILFFNDSLINGGLMVSSDAVLFESQNLLSAGFGIYGELSFLTYISFPVSCSVFIANDTGFSKVSFIMQFGSFRL